MRFKTLFASWKSAVCLEEKRGTLSLSVSDAACEQTFPLRRPRPLLPSLALHIRPVYHLFIILLSGLFIFSVIQSSHLCSLIRHVGTDKGTITHGHAFNKQKNRYIVLEACHWWYVQLVLYLRDKNATNLHTSS